MITCTHCGPRPASEFYKRSQAAGGGLMSECKKCFLARPRNKRRERDNLRSWRERNPNAVKAQNARWRQRHPEKKRLQNLRRHELRRALNADDCAYISVLEADPCAYCGDPMENIDHIEPVNGGGVSNWGNLTAACARCNKTKAEKPLLFWMADR